MTHYRIETSDEARRSFLALQPRIQAQLARRIDSLAMNPFPPGCKALKGKFAGKHRVRSGDYRIIYQVRDRELLIIVVKVGQRSQVYR